MKGKTKGKDVLAGSTQGIRWIFRVAVFCVSNWRFGGRRLLLGPRSVDVNGTEPREHPRVQSFLQSPQRGRTYEKKLPALGGEGVVPPCPSLYGSGDESNQHETSRPPTRRRKKGRTQTIWTSGQRPFRDASKKKKKDIRRKSWNIFRLLLD